MIERRLCEIPDRLTDAYRSAVYRVKLPGENVELRVDVHSASLQRWLEGHEHHCAALLTAHNPESQPRDAALNDAAQRNLQAAIRMRGLPSR